MQLISVVSDTKCKVSLQSLLNPTVEKIVNLPLEGNNENYEFIFKWKFNGSGNHLMYKQTFNKQGYTDRNIICLHIVCSLMTEK